MNLADTLAHAANNGWQTTTSPAHIAGLTRAEISNLTHLIFAWWAGDLFHSAYLYHAGEFEPYLSATCDSHLTAWIACHANTMQAAS